MTVISAIGQRGLSSRSHWRPASRVRRDLESGLKSSAFRRGLIEAVPVVRRFIARREILGIPPRPC